MIEQIAEHIRVVENLRQQTDLLERTATSLIECFSSGGRLYLIGNGGSAADAQHIAAELVGRFKRNRRPLPAIALTTDTSILTAVANDLEYAEIFARQIEAQTRAGDTVWALSVSGTSPNVLRGLEAARRRGATLIAFTGRRGAALAAQCDLCLIADHADSDRVQEVHILAYHLICDRIERHFAG